MIHFMKSHFHSGSCMDNRVKGDKGGSRETSEEAVAIIQGREYDGSAQDDRSRGSKWSHSGNKVF